MPLRGILASDDGEVAVPRVSFGRTLIIANPNAHSGEGARGADIVERVLTDDISRTSSLDIRLTSGVGNGKELAASSAGYDTVIIVGGDGVIHEAVNGLMEIPEEERPRIGIVPMGTGNDFARTLSIPRGDPELAIRRLLSGREEHVDLGLVNGVYFTETLSFGLDALIAIDTIERRREGSTQKGAALFATSGVKIMAQADEGWAYTARFDGIETISGNEVIFAVQNGPTYGGGFRICPKATPTDGLLDVCYSTHTPSIPVVLGLVGAARFGMHAGAKSVRMRQVRTLEIEFPVEPPCQVDGEVLRGSVFDISVVPRAIRVIVPTVTNL
ncbi:MAG: diacylglycerol kinase family lipid kinase [Atopobiaceae bacterium]|nr:diacylglycerol kinase family lipid kinase [Atopobiaceae bacterium]